MRSPRSCLVALTLAGSVSAQTVWQMGTGPFGTDLVATIAAAAPGDIIMLNGLTFPAFTLAKGLTLIGPGTVQPGATGPITTIAIPTGQVAHFVDTEFVPVATWVAHRVEVTGTATFEGCRFGVGVPHDLVSAGNVLLRDCTVEGSPSYAMQSAAGGMRVASGICSLVHCNLTGGDAVLNPLTPASSVGSTPAVTVDGGLLMLATCTVRGGHGVGASLFGVLRAGSPAVLVFGEARITDCTLTAGDSPPPLPGLAALMGNPTTEYARSVLQGGAGQPAGGPTWGWVAAVPQLVGMDIAPGFVLGQSTTLSAVAGGSQLLGIFVGFDATPTSHPAVIGPIVGSLAQLVPCAVVVPQPGGVVQCALFVPNVSPLLGLGVYAQAFELDGAVVRGSAMVGGAVH